MGGAPQTGRSKSNSWQELGPPFPERFRSDLHNKLHIKTAFGGRPSDPNFGEILPLPTSSPFLALSVLHPLLLPYDFSPFPSLASPALSSFLSICFASLSFRAFSFTQASIAVVTRNHILALPVFAKKTPVCDVATHGAPPDAPNFNVLAPFHWCASSCEINAQCCRFQS